MSRRDRRGPRPRLTRYSHAAESGPRPPSACGISPAGDLRVISVSPLPPRSGGRCRRQRGAPRAPSPDSGRSPPSLRDTATGREGRSSGTYAQVSSGGDIEVGNRSPRGGAVAQRLRGRPPLTTSSGQRNPIPIPSPSAPCLRRGRLRHLPPLTTLSGQRNPIPGPRADPCSPPALPLRRPARNLHFPSPPAHLGGKAWADALAFSAAC